MDLQSPITVLPGIGATQAAKLAKLEIRRVDDLLWHLPRRFEDWTQIRPVKSARIGETVTLCATVVWAKNERSPRRRMAITKALLRDASGEMMATWFNQPFLLTTLEPDRELFFRGVVGFDRASNLKQLTNPLFEAQARIVPIYRETAGITSKMLRRYLAACAPLVAAIPEILPPVVLREEELFTRSNAIRLLHHPQTIREIETAQRRIAFDELLLFSLKLGQVKRALGGETAPVLAIPPTELQAFTKALPFTLTDDQRRAAWEIIQDLGRQQPMNRLLEGDVGSGKTAVAAFASFVAARAGYQTIVLVPTTILAEQHAVSFQRLLEPFGLRVELWTSQRKPTGETPPDVLVGTHALLYGALPITKVGLVVVDEQHRFGVEQRAALKNQLGRTHVPHFLSMTATPIPRTLALALYGDLEVSFIRHKPATRKPIVTRLVHSDGRRAAYDFVRAELRAGRQAFVVCPLIDEGPGGDSLFAELEKKSAVAEYERLAKEIFPEFRIGLLHGRLKPREKQAVMAAFAGGKLDVLVATAVIEVGIDVPNATVMLIEGADRFGLAQLHQLRGRVGRGTEQSHCLLFTESQAEVSRNRLQQLEATDDGFALAEADLKLRGPGEFIGQHQAGFPRFRYANLFDFELMDRARRVANKFLDDGPLPGPLADLLAQPEIQHME